MTKEPEPGNVTLTADPHRDSEKADARMVVKAHQGTLDVQSTTGTGVSDETNLRGVQTIKERCGAKPPLEENAQRKIREPLGNANGPEERQ